MHEDHFFRLWENDVRTSWQVLPVETKSESHRMQYLAYDDFRQRVELAYSPHETRALFLAQDISHFVI